MHHPIFARAYRRLAAAAEREGLGDRREQFLTGLTGRVVEVGAGTGLNFAHYPTTVTEAVAMEPEPYLRDHAQAAARAARTPVTVLDGTADALPLPDESVAAGVVSLVLCSVPDQATALAELRRVIRPGGELRFLEHVADTDARWARRQRRIDPLWTIFSGGCHITRDTERAITAAGFEIESCERFLFPTCTLGRLAAPHILGRARRP